MDKFPIFTTAAEWTAAHTEAARMIQDHGYKFAERCAARLAETGNVLMIRRRYELALQIIRIEIQYHETEVKKIKP